MFSPLRAINMILFAAVILFFIVFLSVCWEPSWQHISYFFFYAQQTLQFDYYSGESEKCILGQFMYAIVNNFFRSSFVFHNQKQKAQQSQTNQLNKKEQKNAHLPFKHWNHFNFIIMQLLIFSGKKRCRFQGNLLLFNFSSFPCFQFSLDFSQ